MTRADQRSARGRTKITLRGELSRSAAALVSVAAVVLVLLIWQYASAVAHWISPLILPSPGKVAGALGKYLGHKYLGETLIGHSIVSLKIVLGGWAMGGLVGVPLGVAIGWSQRTRWIIFPIFQVLRPIPPLAWIPLAIVWLGIGDTARIFVVFLAALIPWVMNSIQAVDSVDTILIKAARTLGAGSGTILASVVLRTALPTILAGARVALGNAWMTLIAAELLAASAGLGFVTLTSSKVLDTDIMIAAMLLIGLLGAAFAVLMRWLVRWIAPWAKGT